MDTKKIKEWIELTVRADALREELAEILKEIRGKSGLTLRELAEPMQVTAAYLSDVENGKRGVTLKIAAKYLAVAE